LVAFVENANPAERYCGLAAPSFFVQLCCVQLPDPFDDGMNFHIFEELPVDPEQSPVNTAMLPSVLKTGVYACDEFWTRNGRLDEMVE